MARPEVGQLWPRGDGGGPPPGPSLLTAAMAYSKSPSPGGTFPDTGDTELTDGVFPTGDWPSGANPYVGWQNEANTYVAFDFGDPGKRVTTARAWGLHQSSAGIWASASVHLEWSDDDSAWTEAGAASPAPMGNPGNWDTIVTSTETDPHRYWRIRCVRSGSNEWLFLGEVELYGL